QLTLAVVGELVLHAHSLLGLLGDLLQPPEHTVEVEATTDLAQGLTLPALKELMGDDAAHSTCRGRRQRKRDRQILAVHLSDVLQGDHGVVRGVLEELDRMLVQVLVHAGDPAAGNIQLRHTHASPRSASFDAPDCAIVSRIESSTGRAQRLFSPNSTHSTGLGETMPALAEITARRMSGSRKSSRRFRYPE